MMSLVKTIPLAGARPSTRSLLSKYLAVSLSDAAAPLLIAAALRLL